MRLPYYAVGFLVVVAVFGLIAPVSAENILVNGDFEDTSGTFPTGWSNSSSSTSQHTGIAPGSTTAAYVDSATNGTLGQSFDTLGPQWVVDFYFATEFGTDRGLDLNIQMPSDPYIHVVVNSAGRIQLYNGIPAESGSGWQTLTTLDGIVQASVDDDSSGDFSSAGDTLNVHHMRLEGRDFGTSSAEYDVYLSDANSTTFSHSVLGLTAFQNAASTPLGAGIDAVTFPTLYGNGSFVVDDVVVVPEPSTWALGLLAVVGLALFRRWYAH